jgi:SAM-dependent methyltransferase
MPDAEALARMYGQAYASANLGEPSVEDPKEPAKVLATLERRPPGLFVDFGCGAGSLLREAQALGWRVVGVEFESEVARRTAAETGCPVLHGMDGLRSWASSPADAIHLGDVIEHLTAPYLVLRDLVDLLAPGGWLLAQGPLEAGPCLFSAALRVAARLRGARAVEMPPYHVLQATARGQIAFFERVELKTTEYFVTEVAWPAPGSLSLDLVRRPKSVGLFALRKMSQALSVLNSRRLGNRYFYLGENQRGKSSRPLHWPGASSG